MVMATNGMYQEKYGLGGVPMSMQGINPMAMINANNISAWMVMNQFGDVVAGPGAARDNIMPMSIANINKDEHRQILRARRYAMECSLKFAMRKQQEKKQKIQAQQVQRQRAVAIMCKIYVGSIYYEIGEATIKQAFETFGPVRSIDMSYDQGTQRHKGFCFLEFETPEAAFMSLEHMQSVTIGGRAVKVGRLSNIGQAQHFIQQFAQEASKYNRVYISNIHSNISDEDIRAVFESFGKVLSCQLVRNPDTGVHKHYGFVEYEQPQSMKEAITAMNGFDLGGQLIRVGPCVVPPSMHNLTTVSATNPNAALNAARNISDMLAKMKKGKGDRGRKSHSRSRSNSREKGLTVTTLSGAKIQMKNLNQTLADAEGDMKISGGAQRNMVMRKLMRQPKSKVLVLRNMLAADELDAEVEQEVTEECSTYGVVQRVVIYQEKQSDAPNAESLVKIFVEFAEPDGCEAAKNQLGGRFFNGRKIQATNYDQQAFDMKDYTA